MVAYPGYEELWQRITEFTKIRILLVVAIGVIDAVNPVAVKLVEVVWVELFNVAFTV
jgi:hypothetical protein